MIRPDGIKRLIIRKTRNSKTMNNPVESLSLAAGLFSQLLDLTIP